MIFVIMNYGVNRNQLGRRWSSKAIAFGVGAAAAGVTMGLALGLVGSFVPERAKLAVLAVTGVAAVAIAGVRLGGKAAPPPQRNCETVQLWMNTGARTGAAMNGIALGLGFVTRIGYWLWFVVPITAFLMGPWLGAVTFGAYGACRGLAPTAAILIMMTRRRCDDKDITRSQEWLIAQRQRALLAADGLLLLVGLNIVGMIAL